MTLALHKVPKLPPHRFDFEADASESTTAGQFYPRFRSAVGGRLITDPVTDEPYLFNAQSGWYTRFPVTPPVVGEAGIDAGLIYRPAKHPTGTRGRLPRPPRTVLIGIQGYNAGTPAATALVAALSDVADAANAALLVSPGNLDPLTWVLPGSVELSGANDWGAGPVDPTMVTGGEVLNVFSFAGPYFTYGSPVITQADKDANFTASGYSFFAISGLVGGVQYYVFQNDNLITAARPSATAVYERLARFRGLFLTVPDTTELGTAAESARSASAYFDNYAGGLPWQIVEAAADSYAAPISAAIETYWP